MFSTDAPPGGPAERGAAKPLSTLGAIGVAGTTAALVFASGVYIVEKQRAGAPEAPRTDTEGAAAAASAGATVTAARPGAAAQAAPEPRSAPTASAAAPGRTGTAAEAPIERAVTSPSAAQAPAPLAEKPDAPREGYGALKVTSVLEGTVYVTGVAVGLSNRPIEARCGPYFVRLGEPSANGTRWLGEGRTVVIRCGALTEVDFQRQAPRPSRRTRRPGT